VRKRVVEKGKRRRRLEEDENAAVVGLCSSGEEGGKRGRQKGWMISEFVASF